MQLILSVIPLTLFAVASRDNPENPLPAVPVVKVAIGKLALRQLMSAPPKPAHQAPVPVTSLEGGLPHARKASMRPILAMSESQGWFIYATVVARDKNGRPVYIISGCGIKRGGRQVRYFSVW